MPEILNDLCLLCYWFAPGVVGVVLFCYATMMLSVTVCSVGWFMASGTNEILVQMPPAAIWIHNTFGVFSYMTFPFMPIVAGSELVSTYLINCLARYFEAWAAGLTRICSDEKNEGY